MFGARASAVIRDIGITVDELGYVGPALFHVPPSSVLFISEQSQNPMTVTYSVLGSPGSMTSDEIGGIAAGVFGKVGGKVRGTLSVFQLAPPSVVLKSAFVQQARRPFI